MADVPNAQQSSQGDLGFFKTIVLTGAVVGTLDGLAAAIAFMIVGGNPVRVFVYISSGVFGKEAFSLGDHMALWGVLFHYTIALSWTALFFLSYPKLPVFSANKIVSGVGYGVFVWLVMNLVVLPLSNVPPLKYEFARILQGVVILIICVGLPISYSAAKFYNKKSGLSTSDNSPMAAQSLQ